MTVLTATLVLTGTLVWGFDQEHQSALNYQQSAGKIPEGIALTQTLALNFPGSCAHIGELWELRLPDGLVLGPLWVHDCVKQRDEQWNLERNRVAEVCRTQALALHYPEGRFVLPRDGPLAGVTVRPYQPPWFQRQPKYAKERGNLAKKDAGGTPVHLPDPGSRGAGPDRDRPGGRTVPLLGMGQVRH